METLKKYPMKSTQTASRIVDGEAVIVLPLESAVNTLNEIGTRIWEMSDGTNTVTDIIQQIQQEFDVEADVAQDDTLSFIHDLVDKKMIVLKD
jgi:hypothetical protein